MFFYTQKGETVLINMVLYTEDIVLTGSILGTLFCIGGLSMDALDRMPMKQSRTVSPPF